MKLGAEYRRIWAGNASSNLADGITFIALPLLAADLTSSPAAIAGLPLAHAVPRILAVLGLGVLIDRGDRRVLLYRANFARAAVFAVLTMLVATHTASLPVLYAVFVVMGVVETLSDNTAFAVLPQAVTAAGLDRANSRIAGTQLIVDEFAGPPLGGFLFAAAAFAPSGLNTLAFLAAGVSYFLLRGNYRVPAGGTAPPAGVYAGIREGISWTWHHRIVRTTVVIGTIAGVGYMIPFSYLVLYAREVLGLSSAEYGLLLSASALGGLAGAWSAGRLRARIGYGWSIAVALATGSASFLVISVTENLVAVAVALAAYIGHSALWNVLAASVRQKATPAALMGRVISATRLMSFCGLALGALLGGRLATTFGLRAPFLVAGALFAAATAVSVLAIPRFRAWERGGEE
ncbi:MFS transporter [Streptomyces iconiensis]|uniref:MFS transporter n=1 Tax=Streptomyces iconiensis TaxID=1384038 RepID=A0ABT6ZQX8_9ACTN|nr:MFS transporter [Streptomyces iconiensis]MDJ1131199.1 MFS transporter [Streptomyces iconiensis]